jgi:uncharacterized protein YbgA (DUF1722 family)
MVGSLVGGYLSDEMDLNAEEQEQLNELIGAYISGETPSVEGTEELVGKVVGSYIGSGSDLSESEKEQLNEAVGKYISGELTIDQEVLDALLKKNG